MLCKSIPYEALRFSSSFFYLHFTTPYVHLLFLVFQSSFFYIAPPWSIMCPEEYLLKISTQVLTYLLTI